MKPWIAGAVAAMALGASAPAFAHSECTDTITRLYVDNSGYIWVSLAGGGAAEITNTNPNKVTYYSALLSAKMSGKAVTFRYTKDTSTCTAVNSDLMALWVE
ncbi:hypothetical protein ASD79_05810 [Caulobacter sp. Root655]|uniref:hypothetical protein n=1 Tax=Caulobacter sp. Root655 TaxID=1736578 RepID=UPI0006FEC0BD|nr:hypothetical protein [Caulobacter sp. Root655]KRA61629.1 hypothetical protein ASD79_05810 [Caulobacter sp. Root655]